MKTDSRTCWFVLLLTLMTSLTPLQELAAADSAGRVESPGRAPVRTTIRDIELTAGGRLVGQALDSSGQPLAGQAIAVHQSGSQPSAGHTDQAGRFQLEGIHPGLCRVECGEAVLACRCWSPNTAPPAAQDQLLLVPVDSVERGQRSVGDLLTGPVLIGLIIAAAIIIPIAVHNSQKDAS